MGAAARDACVMPLCVVCTAFEAHERAVRCSAGIRRWRPAGCAASASCAGTTLQTHRIELCVAHLHDVLQIDGWYSVVMLGYLIWCAALAARQVFDLGGGTLDVALLHVPANASLTGKMAAC